MKHTFNCKNFFLQIPVKATICSINSPVAAAVSKWINFLMMFLIVLVIVEWRTMPTLEICAKSSKVHMNKLKNCFGLGFLTLLFLFLLLPTVLRHKNKIKKV